MELYSLKQLPKEFKIELLGKLGYSLDGDGIHIVDLGTGNRAVDKYSHQEIRFDRMMILPGSALLLDDNEFSLFSYIQEKGDILG